MFKRCLSGCLLAGIFGLYIADSSAQSGIDSYTKLMLHADGSDQGTSFTDSSSGAKTITNTETYDSYTKLMLKMENNVTDSAAGKTVTNNNATFSSSVYKMGGYSGVFNGSNAYLSLADSDDWNFGSGDFTIDFWVRFNTFPTLSAIYQQYVDTTHYASIFISGSSSIELSVRNGGSEIINPVGTLSSVTTGVWYHFALVRNGNIWRWYQDGSSIGSITNANSIPDFAGEVVIGKHTHWTGGDNYLNGYIDELRISKGIARWTSDFTPPSSPYGKVATVTSQKKFGTASSEFHGSGDYLSLADLDDWSFGSGDFTIDFWVRFNSLPSSPNHFGLIGQTGDGNNDWEVELYNDSGTYRLRFDSKTGAVDQIADSHAVSISTGVWYHIAAVRSGNNFYMFLNGIQLDSTYNAASKVLANSTSTLRIGCRAESPTNFLDGWLDEIRISKGIARWTSNFTPPTAPYETDTTPPTVSSTSPTSSATGVGVSSAISATFSEDMDSSTITTSTFTLSSSNGSSVSGTVSYSNKTATFTPSSNLSYSTAYTATITTGVKDSGGNAMSSAYTWSFTTSTATATPTPTPSPGDTTAPIVTITSPTSGSTYTTTSSAITLSGTASDNSGSVSSVTWSNSKGGSGTASGTTNWTISGISLSSGDNVITVTATDGSGNFGTDTITVTYTVTTTPTPTAVPTATPTPIPTPTAQPTPTRPPTLPPLPTPQPSPSPAQEGVVFGFVNDEDDQSLEGVTVTIVGANGDSSSQETETDDNGYYEFRGLDAGEYTITYEKEGFLAQTLDISLEEGGLKDVETVILEKVERGKIYGYAVNIKGDPIEFVRLKLRGIKTKVTRSASSDADGFFEFADLDADTYVIIAKKKGFRKNQQKVKLEEGESEEIEIVMKKTSKRIKELLLEEDVQ